jgi:hypothetical protein
VGQHLPPACLNIKAEQIISHDTKICFSGFLQAFDEFNIIAYKIGSPGVRYRGFYRSAFSTLRGSWDTVYMSMNKIFNISSTGRNVHCLATNWA